MSSKSTSHNKTSVLYADLFKTIKTKLNYHPTVRAARITAAGSIIGSVIVAIVVGGFTYFAYIDAAKNNSQSQEKVMKETIKAQLEIAQLNT